MEAPCGASFIIVPSSKLESVFMRGNFEHGNFKSHCSLIRRYSYAGSVSFELYEFPLCNNDNDNQLALLWGHRTAMWLHLINSG